MDWTQKFEKVLEAMAKKGKEYAEFKSMSWLLQEQKSTVLSSIMTRFSDEDPKMTAAKCEARARASEEYQNHLKGTSEAIRQELTAKAQYEKLFSQYEAYRSLISLDKKTGGFSNV